MPLVNELGFSCFGLHSFTIYASNTYYVPSAVYSTEQNKCPTLIKTENQYLMQMVICTMKKKKARVGES